MSLLGVDELLKMVREQKLVEDLCERELTNPEGSGFDIRLGEVYKMAGDAFLGVDERNTPDVTLVAKYGRDKSYTLNPGEYVLGKTIEKVNLPLDVAAYTNTRSTLFRSGVLLLGTQIAPGYSGPLIYGMKNLGESKVTFELGARVVHLHFHRITGQGSAYRGQWQQGRVTTGGTEKQV